MRRDERHGQTSGEKSTTYQSWQHMLARCRNPRTEGFAEYGGRGITFHPTWSLFSNFLRDMGLRPDGTTLDRIDNDRNYEPGNCRWANPKEQALNRRTTIIVTIGGISGSIKAVAASAGLSDQALRYRMRRGWPEERLLEKAHNSGGGRQPWK